MKQGDVFIIDEKGPLFIADTVTPSGAVYAREFDIYKGAYGGTKAFPLSTEFRVLFNSLNYSGNFAGVKIGLVTLENFVLMRKENSQASIESSNSIGELEKRMRPGAYSEGGFLGITESLESVLAKDDQFLAKLEISFEKIASELKAILRKALELQHKLHPLEYKKRNSYSFNINQNSEKPIITLENLPDLEVGYLIDKFQVFFSGTKGIQECPWGCHLSDTWSSFIFVLLNRQTGEYVIAPGLIVHLIREHHFFEGIESPYRVEPLELVQVLGLVP